MSNNQLPNDFVENLSKVVHHGLMQTDDELRVENPWIDTIDPNSLKQRMNEIFDELHKTGVDIGVNDQAGTIDVFSTAWAQKRRDTNGQWIKDIDVSLICLGEIEFKGKDYTVRIVPDNYLQQKNSPIYPRIILAKP